jgi:hypothetical protein
LQNKSDKIKAIDRKASDNEYMHKDFHGTLGFTYEYDFSECDKAKCSLSVKSSPKK